MKTSWSSSMREAGFTLFELLIVLLIMASLAGVSAAAFKPALRSANLDYASSLLVADLKNARRLAQRTATPVKVRFTEHGYVVDALNIERKLNGRLRLLVDGESHLKFDTGGLSQGTQIQLTNGRQTTSLSVTPLTGRIWKHNENQ